MKERLVQGTRRRGGQLSTDRWIEVSPSEFSHETEGLQYLQDRMPAKSPYRGWSNFEFRDTHGRWHEVDAMILNRNTLYIVELKYYRGTISGTDTVWRRQNGTGLRSEDSPLMLAQKKARLFASRLKVEFTAWAEAKNIDARSYMHQVVPFVKAAVFLHHPRVQVELSEHSKQDLWGLDETHALSGLPGISELIHEPPHKGTPVGENQAKILTDLIARLGVERREREVGNWILHAHEIVNEGSDSYDLVATYRPMQERQALVRIPITPPDASHSEREQQLKIATHELRLMSKLSHEALILPVDVLELEEGAALVYDYDEEFQRLDLWMEDQENGVVLHQQLDIIRQIAEALDYAHRNAVVHRDLSPGTVWVKQEGTHLKVGVSDWQTAGAASAEATDAGVTRLVQTQFTVQDRLSGDNEPDLAAPYRAPEGRWIGASADRVGLDVFSLGALAFYILTGSHPAESQLDLAEKLREQDGLDVSVVVPELSSNIRLAILNATRPRPTERTRNVQLFLDELEQPENEEVPVADPLEASPGVTMSNGRFLVKRRLGKGSTAVGLEVEDRLAKRATTRVLKVALNEKAALRLHDEAEVMGELPRSPRLVKLLEGPIDVDGRAALLLEPAGPETLAEVLRARQRLSLDLIERYGNDLLHALEELDAAGIVHRDIKPSNLGVRPDSRRAKHLVLFDFSASRAHPEHLDVGTAPYLDPFLGSKRPQYDSAAERYSAAVVLYEMATGKTPQYGDDPYAAPTAVKDDITLAQDDFDPTVQEPLMEFFERALARDAAERFDTVQEMRLNWQRIFSADKTTAPEDADELAENAKIETPLEHSGLSGRALSALEPFHLKTVGDLVAVDPVLITRMAGVAQPTRLEVQSRAKVWRKRFGKALADRTAATALPTVLEVAQQLVQVAHSDRTDNTAKATELLLGLDGKLDPFATQAELGASLGNGLTAAGTNQLLNRLQKAWVQDDESLRLLRKLDTIVDDRIEELGQVATPAELAEEILQHIPAGGANEKHLRRIALGLLRTVIDRRRILLLGDTEHEPLEIRRRGKHVIAVARDVRFLDLAETLSAEAEALVQRNAEEELVSAKRVEEKLRNYRNDKDPIELWEGLRPVRLAAHVSSRVAATSLGELYARDLAPHRVAHHVLGGIGIREQFSPNEIRERVNSRFPSYRGFPPRPELDKVLREAGIELRFDETRKRYVSPTVRGDTTGLYTHVPTHVVDPSEDLDDAALTQRLRDSVERRSYLVLGARPDRMARLQLILEQEFSAEVIDITGLLLDQLQNMTEMRQAPSWEALASADAQPDTTRPRKGLQKVIDHAIPNVQEHLREVLNDQATTSPVVLTNPESLVRYGHGGLLRKLSDLSAKRSRAVWVLAPQFGSHVGAVIDDVSIQTSPQQFVPVDAVWIDPRAAKLQELSEEQGIQ